MEVNITYLYPLRSKMKLLKTIAALGAAASVGLATAPANAQSNNINLETMGVQAPQLDVGTGDVKPATLQYSNSGGTSDAFSVGTSTSISASASASSTPDYNVTSSANFGVDSSAIKQIIGTSGASEDSTSRSNSVDVERSAAASAEAKVSREYKQESGGYYWWRNNSWEQTNQTDYETERSSSYDSAYNRAYEDINSTVGSTGTISGSFNKTSGTDASTNDVTVMGIGADNAVTAAEGSAFKSDIVKGSVANNAGTVTSETNTSNTGDTSTTTQSTSAGTASGSAAGNVSTTASANASSTQFVSSFVQAY